jgi:hypothetical protein
MWYKIKAFIIKWFGDILFYKYPLFIVFGHTAYKMKGEDVRTVLDIIQPGDILLRRYDSYISGLMIPGYYTHAAVYVGDNNVVHMLGDGITKEDILTFTRCDSLAIIHCNEEQMINEAIEKANTSFGKGIVRKRGIQYDYNFDFSDDSRFSCTEFIDFIYNKPKFTRKNEKYIMPDDLLTLDNKIFNVSYKKG